jgi:hypothetical protein
MQSNHSSKILIPWILVTALGNMLGAMIGPTAGETIGFFLGDQVETILQEIWKTLPSGYLSSMLAGFVNGMVAGAILGFFQWLSLRRWIRNAGWWILLTALGSAAAGLFGSALFNYSLNVLAGTAFALLIGLVITSPISALFITFAQWLLLAKQFERSFWWIPASLLGWILGNISLAFGFFIALILGLANTLTEGILGAAVGILIGLITGLALVFMLGGPSSDDTA